MTKRRRRILLWTGIAVIFLIIGLRVYYVTCLRGPKVIRTWVQPRDVHYDDHDPYALTLVRGGYQFGWPHFRCRYYLVFGPAESIRQPDTWVIRRPLSFRGGLLSNASSLKIRWMRRGPVLIDSSTPAVACFNKSYYEDTRDDGGDAASVDSASTWGITTFGIQ